MPGNPGMIIPEADSFEATVHPDTPRDARAPVKPASPLAMAPALLRGSPRSSCIINPGTEPLGAPFEDNLHSSSYDGETILRWGTCSYQHNNPRNSLTSEQTRFIQFLGEELLIHTHT